VEGVVTNEAARQDGRRPEIKAAGESKFMWMVLERKFVATSTLICTSDMPGPREFTFRYKKRGMEVLIGDEAFISTDGRSYLKVGETLFKTRRRKLRLQGLFSAEDSFLFDWDLEGNPENSVVGISRARHDESYLIRSRTSSLWLTQTRIDVAEAGSGWNMNYVTACLAFFWAYFENDRTSFG
jgi:hypothetical protein